MASTVVPLFRRPRWMIDLGLVFMVAAAFLAIHAAQGFPTLSDVGGDNDSLLRLVQVRDLISGQGWLDLHQYRMGPEGGFLMHWSRLVDAPIAAIILAVSTLTGSMAAGEAAALVLWPLLLFAAALFFLLRIARRLVGPQVVLPVLMIGGMALYFVPIFRPGALDHHNIQLVLTLAMMALIMEAPQRGWAGYAAGACAAIMIAIGMETAPYVAAGGAFVAVRFLAASPGARQTALGFGIGFAVLTSLVFGATVPPGAWFTAACDAFSVTQLSVALLAGLGLTLIAALPALNSTATARTTALMALCLSVATLALVAFPQCLSGPFVGFPPQLRAYWLDGVTEAQSLQDLIARRPAMAVSHYATALVAAAIMALRFARARFRSDEALVATMLGTALLVSIWQVRGSTFAIPFAAIPLSAFVAEWRERAYSGRERFAMLKLAFAWLVSFNFTWSSSANALTSMLGTEGLQSAEHAASGCTGADAHRVLAAMTPTGVLAISNLGAPILRYTGHRVLSGPYHRNVKGNLLALDAFMGSSDEAREIVTVQKISFVAHCRGNGESSALARWAPDGFMAALMRGSAPSWLELLPETAGKPLQIYRVRPDAAPVGQRAGS